MTHVDPAKTFEGEQEKQWLLSSPKHVRHAELQGTQLRKKTKQDSVNDDSFLVVQILHSSLIN